ncbi:hypothetical protein BBJ28_00023886 [Nothophytophthora sp. Chile5]|nr:hypothetical protein BBJ28_00023886 [Nothophytophthora sp. Chile5]
MEQTNAAHLAAHFEAKRRILATVKQMEERGEKLEEATPEEVMEAAHEAAQSVFRFEFSISDEANGGEEATTDAKKKRNRKKGKKRRGNKAGGNAVIGEQTAECSGELAKKSEDKSTSRLADNAPEEAQAPPAQRPSKKKKPKKLTDLVHPDVKAAATAKTPATTTSSSSFVKLRKATGTESEVAKMHLRYGQGRRNLAAIKQREQRLKAKPLATSPAQMSGPQSHEAAPSTSEFKFNFATTT